MSDEDLGKAMRAVWMLVNGLEVPQLTGTAWMLFTTIRRDMERKKVRQDNGAKGGRPKLTETETEVSKSETKVFDLETKVRQHKTKTKRHTPLNPLKGGCLSNSGTLTPRKRAREQLERHGTSSMSIPRCWPRSCKLSSGRSSPRTGRRTGASTSPIQLPGSTLRAGRMKNQRQTHLLTALL